jgi:hypothetical protein
MLHQFDDYTYINSIIFYYSLHIEQRKNYTYVGANIKYTDGMYYI